MVRFWSLWCLASTAVLVATCTYAQQTRKQFYPTVIYLVTSKFSVAVLGNMCLVVLFLFGKITTAIFFGTLRDREYAVCILQPTPNTKQMKMSVSNILFSKG